MDTTDVPDHRSTVDHGHLIDVAVPAVLADVLDLIPGHQYGAVVAEVRIVVIGIGVVAAAAIEDVAVIEVAVVSVHVHRIIVTTVVAGLVQ